MEPVDADVVERLVAADPLGDERGGGRPVEPLEQVDRQVGAVEQRRLAGADREQHGDRVGDHAAEREQQRVRAGSRRSIGRRRRPPATAPPRRRPPAG